MVFPRHSQELPVLRVNRDYPEGRLDVGFGHETARAMFKNHGNGIIDTYVLEGEVFNGYTGV